MHGAFKKGERKMKITVEKQFTTLALLPQVKADMKEFKARYTDIDLLNAFIDATDIVDPYAADILRCDVEAFPAGTDFNDETHFFVEMVTFSYAKICVLRFYVDMNLTVDTRRQYLSDDMLYSCTVYLNK